MSASTPGADAHTPQQASPPAPASPDSERIEPIHPDDINELDGTPLGMTTKRNPLADSPDDGE